MKKKIAKPRETIIYKVIKDNINTQKPAVLSFQKVDVICEEFIYYLIKTAAQKSEKKLC